MLGSRPLLRKVREIIAEEPRLTWNQIGKRLGEDPEKLRSLYRRARKKDEDFPKKGSQDLFDNDEYLEEEDYLTCEDKKYAEKIDWRELISHAEKGVEINERLSVTQKIAHMSLKTDEPIAVVYTGDWHLGSNITNYLEWRKDMQFIMDTDNLYMVTLGDDNENMRNFKTLKTVLSQVLSPPQQVSLMFSLIDELTSKNKLLAKISGNHESEFDERLFGQSLMAYLYESMNAPVFENRGLLKLKVGRQNYNHLLFHKSRFRSFLRPAHGAFREWQLSYPAEVVVGAHDHVPGAEIMYGYTLAQQDGQDIGGEVFLLKIGSYTDGDYGWKYFHNGSIMTPTVVYYPDRHKKLLFTNPRDAMQYLGGTA